MLSSATALPLITSAEHVPYSTACASRAESTMGVAETPTCVVIAYARAADPCFGASLGATTARSERGAAAGRRSASLSSAGMTR